MDPDIAVALRRTGIDVTTTLEQGMPGQPDDIQFDYCVKTGRVIVTDDTDLLALAAAAPRHPGVVYCRRIEHTMGQIIQFLILVHGVYDQTDMVGRIEYL